MSEESPPSPIPTGEQPKRNITGKMIAIMLLILGGFVVVITAYYIADNYPIFDNSEPTAIEQQRSE